MIISFLAHSLMAYYLTPNLKLPVYSLVCIHTAYGCMLLLQCRAGEALTDQGRDGTCGPREQAEEIRTNLYNARQPLQALYNNAALPCPTILKCYVSSELLLICVNAMPCSAVVMFV